MGKNRPRSKGVDVTKSLLATTGVADYLTVQIVPGQTVQVTCDDMSPTQGSEAAAALRREGKLDVTLRLCTNWKQGSCYNRAACTFAHVHRYFNVDGTNRTDSMSYAAAVTANNNREGGLVISNNNNSSGGANTSGVFTFTSEHSLTPTTSANNVGEGNNANSSNSVQRNVSGGDEIQQQQQQQQQQNRRQRRQSNEVSIVTLNDNESDNNYVNGVSNNSKINSSNSNNACHGGSTYASKCAPYSNVVKNGRTAATGVAFTPSSTNIINNNKKNSFLGNGGSGIHSSITNNNRQNSNNNNSRSSHSGSHNSISKGTLSWLEKLAPNSSHPTHINGGEMCFTSTSMETVEEFASDDNNNFNEHLQEGVHHDNEQSIENKDEDEDEGNEDEINDNNENDEGIGKQEVKCVYSNTRKQLNTSASHVKQVHNQMQLNEEEQEEEEEEEEEQDEEEEELELLLESPIQSLEQRTRPRLVGERNTVEYQRENGIDTNNTNNNTTLEHVNTNKLVHKGKSINLHDLQREREIKDKVNEKLTNSSHFNTTTDIIHSNNNNSNSRKKKNVFTGNEAIAETSPQDFNSQSLCESESGGLVEHSRHFSHSSISSQPSLRDADHHTFVNSIHDNKNIIIDHNNSSNSSSKRQFDSNNKTNNNNSNNHNHELEHQPASSSKFTFSSLSPYGEQQQLEQQQELQFSESNTTQQMYQPRYNSGVNESNMLPPPPPLQQHSSSLPSMFPAHNTNAPISSYPNLYTYNNSSRNNTTLHSATALNYSNNNNNNYNENNNIKSSINNAGTFNNHVDTVGYGHSNNQIGSFKKNSIHHMPHSFAPSALSAVTAMYDTNTLMSNTTNERINNYNGKSIMCCNTTQKAIGRLHYHISEFTSWPIWLCGSLHPLLLKEKNEQTQMEQMIAEEQLVGNASIPSLEQRTDDGENEATSERRHQSHIMLSVEDMTLKNHLMRELIGCDEYRYIHTNEVMTENTNNNNRGIIIEQNKLELCNSAEEVEGDVRTQAADLANKTNYNDSTNVEFGKHADEVHGVGIDSDNVMHYPIQLSSTEPTKSEQFSEPLFSPATNTNYSSHDESDGDVQQREINGQYTNELQELIWLLTNSKSEQELEENGTADIDSVKKLTAIQKCL